MSVVYNAFNQTKQDRRSSSAVCLRTGVCEGSSEGGGWGALQLVWLVALENTRLKKKKNRTSAYLAYPEKQWAFFFFFLGGGKGGMCLRSNFTDVCMKENADY